MFQPVIPFSGNSGWQFLQSTYDRQLESFSSSSQVKADRAYFTEKFAKPMTSEAFLDDKRLLRVAMTAFGLGGEEWKRGFIDKVLTESTDPESTFLARLNNAQYTAFAKAFTPVNGKISVEPEALEKISAAYSSAAFEAAVGEVDDTMRLSLNYQSDIEGLMGNGSSQTAILYRILGDVPVRTVLEGALSLPSSMRSLDIDRQAEILKDALQSKMGINDVHDLADPEKVDQMLRRYHALQSLANGGGGTSSASNALTLLNGGVGLGGQSGINLLLSGL
jgi:hypothetical protein